MWKKKVRRKKKIADRIILRNKTNFKDLIAIVDLKTNRGEDEDETETGFHAHYCDPHSKPDFAKYVQRRPKMIGK